MNLRTADEIALARIQAAVARAPLWSDAEVARAQRLPVKIPLAFRHRVCERVSTE